MFGMPDHLDTIQVKSEGQSSWSQEEVRAQQLLEWTMVAKKQTWI